MEGAKEFEEFKDIPIVEISKQGIFKYILITVETIKGEAAINFIRGNQDLDYHADILDEFLQNLKTKGFQVKETKKNGKFRVQKNEEHYILKCQGGGRI